MCDSNIHDELINLEQSICPFCDQLLMRGDNGSEPCCVKQCIENLNGIRTCIHCGSTHSCVFDIGYHDFYENIHRIHQKSVYHRKYHIENTLNNICIQNRVELTHDQRDRIYKVFAVIGTILDDVNGTRKRMISVNYIMRRIFEMMELPYNEIPVTKSKKNISFL